MPRFLDSPQWYGSNGDLLNAVGVSQDSQGILFLNPPYAHSTYFAQTIKGTNGQVLQTSAGGYPSWSGLHLYYYSFSWSPGPTSGYFINFILPTKGIATPPLASGLNKYSTLASYLHDNNFISRDYILCAIGYRVINATTKEFGLVSGLYSENGVDIKIVGIDFAGENNLAGTTLGHNGSESLTYISLNTAA